MAASLSTAVVKDGNGTAIASGVRAIDESGSGAGPFRPASTILDGSGVSNALKVSANGEASIGGAAAHDAAVAGNPVRTGARAVSSNVTAVSSGDTADIISTLVGAQITKPYSIPESDWHYAAAPSGIVNTTTAVTIKTAAGSGLKNYITWIDIMAEALTNATEVAIRDGASGTVLWRTKIGTDGLINGRTIHLPSPISGSANTLLEVVTLTASGAGAVYVNAGGYAAP